MYNQVNPRAGSRDPGGDYRRRVRERGRRFFAALDRELPGAPILMFWVTVRPWKRTTRSAPTCFRRFWTASGRDPSLRFVVLCD
jgi:hypothetical protein